MRTATTMEPRSEEAIELEEVTTDEGRRFFTNRKSLYLTFWLLVPLILPTCAFLYALPLAPVIWLGARVAGTATSNHSETIVAIILLTSLALAVVTIVTLWQRTKLIARSLI